MTLQFKLCEPFGGLRTKTVNELEKIADDFAIDFAKWCVITQAFGLYGYEKALEIYKKENNL